MFRNFRKLMLMLVTLLVVLLYFNIRVVQDIIHLPNNDADHHHGITAFKPRGASKVSVVSRSTPSVNSEHRTDPPPLAKVKIVERPCDEMFKLYWKFAKSNYLSDFDMDCLLRNYNVKGIQYLDKASKLSFLKCNPDYTRYGRKGNFRYYLNVKPTTFGNCTKLSDMHFVNGTRVITLVSFPGSGNTWTRLLLEQATGIFTGSIFCDQDLRSSGFFGEQIISSNVLAVKTHYPGIGKPKINHFNPVHVDGVIFIMRNPLDSIVAERKRLILRANKHTGDVGPEHFGNNMDWINFVHIVMNDVFPPLIRYWLDEANIPALVIKYEDMLTDLQTQLEKMLHFLQVSYSKKQFDCVVSDKMDHFHRKKVFNFDHYTPELRKVVIDGLKNVEPILNKYNISYKNVIYNKD